MVIRKALWLGKGKVPASAPDAAPMEVDAICKPCCRTRSQARLRFPSLAAEAAKEENPAEPATQPLSASPVPPAPAAELEAQVTDAEIMLTFGDRRYRVRGLARNFELRSS